MGIWTLIDAEQYSVPRLKDSFLTGATQQRAAVLRMREVLADSEQTNSKPVPFGVLQWGTGCERG